MDSSQNMYKSDTWHQQIISRNIDVYTNTFIHVITICKKRGYKFEGGEKLLIWEGLDQGEGRTNVAIKL